MLKDDATLMVDDFKQLAEYLKKKGDEEEIKLFLKVVRDTDTFITNIFELGNKMLDKKEGGE